MKKAMLVLAVAFGVSSAFAQDLTSKKGEPFLPETDDWAVSIEANPLLNYLGNALNGNTSNTPPSWNFLNSNLTIIGKMFKDEKTAYRAIIRIGTGSVKTTEMIADATVTTPPTFPAPYPMVSDVEKVSGNSIGLGGGLEMRRGKTRLQGVYGGEALLWTSAGKTTYEYGNALSATVDATAATSTDFGGNLGVDPQYLVNARMTESKTGRTLAFAVRGFIGAEYFIFPKMSIGGEFGWGIGISSTGAGSETWEMRDPAAPGAGVGITRDTGKSSAFWIDVDQNLFGTGNASLRLNLHF